MLAVDRWNDNGPHLKLGEAGLIIVGLDSFICFLVILGLLALNCISQDQNSLSVCVYHVSRNGGWTEGDVFSYL